jgi:hypothetical protein
VEYIVVEELEILVLDIYFVEIGAVEIDLRLLDDDRQLKEIKNIFEGLYDISFPSTWRSNTAIKFSPKSMKIRLEYYGRLRCTNINWRKRL